MIEQLVFYTSLFAIGAALLLIAQLAASPIRETISFPAIFMVVALIATLLKSAPIVPFSGALAPWVGLASVSASFWIWLFARGLLECEPAARTTLAIAAALLTAWFADHFLDLAGPLGFYAVRLIALALIVDLVRTALTDRERDLSGEQRALRLWLPPLVVGQTGTQLLAELVFAPVSAPAAVQLFNAVMIFVFIVFAGLALMRANPSLLQGPVGAPEDGGDRAQ
jgi:hypothetical protein